MNQNENSPHQLQNDQHNHNRVQTHQMAESAKDMNEHLMRCYYKITKLETNAIEYRSDLLPLFPQKYPQISNLKEQTKNVQYKRMQNSRRT